MKILVAESDKDESFVSLLMADHVVVPILALDVSKGDESSDDYKQSDLDYFEFLKSSMIKEN